MSSQKTISLQDFFDKLSSEEINKLNKQELEYSAKEYKKFKKALANGRCYLCGQSLDFFDENNQCIHWLLWPKGIKKRQLKKLFEDGNIGYFRADSFVRWLASTEKLVGNINNLIEESSKSKKIECTVKYKNFEWSFSCAQSDFLGHKEKSFGNFPHYHLSITINGKSVISFSDFHIPFSNEDFFLFDATESGYMEHVRTHDAGLQEIIDNVSPERIIDTVRSTDDPQKAVWRIQTFLEAPKGKTISGNKIAELIKESKNTGVPLARLVRKLGCKQRTVIFPCESTPKLFMRKKRKR